MENISANGFAFLCDAPFFADSKGTDILLNILSFDLPDQAALEGHIIRSSDARRHVYRRLPDAGRQYGN